MIFADRKDAGEQLGALIAKKLPELKKSLNVIVLALPRGGVPVAFEIAHKLKVPLDIIVTHKLGAPYNEEFAIGAVAEDGSTFLDVESTRDVSKEYLEMEIKRQLAEIKKRIKKYRGGQPLSNLQNKIVILVDDGIATGNTMKAAIALAKHAKASRIIVATPVIPTDTVKTLKNDAEIFFLDTPFPFLAIGRFYEKFDQLTDEEVQRLTGR